jgi:hypothetical protein
MPSVVSFQRLSAITKMVKSDAAGISGSARTP